jgi:hypothetical protein
MRVVDPNPAKMIGLSCNVRREKPRTQIKHRFDYFSHFNL